MKQRPALALTCWLACLSVAGGCAGHSEPNPSFPVTVEQAETAIEWMKAHPKTLQRPVFVLGGWAGLGYGTHGVGDRLREMVGDQRVYVVPYVMHFSMDQCRDTTLKKVQEYAPSDDPTQTVEVDIVGLSMGVLVARYAAMPPPEGGQEHRRLRMKRLFSIAGPHRGAVIATVPFPPYPLNLAMMPNSSFIQRLDADLPNAEYTMYNYVRLGDGVTGVRNAAPPGEVAWWVPNPFMGDAHVDALKDPRILADIARRLRGEPPFTTEPRAPLPK